MSTLFSPVNLIAMVLFAAALAWRIYQVTRAPTVPNWAVTACVAGFAAAFLLQQPVLSGEVDALLGRGAARVANNALLACGLCALVIFFLGSAIGPRRYRRVVVELIPLAAAITLMIVAMDLTRPELRGLPLGPSTIHDNGVAIFYLGAGLYLIYGLIACAAWIVRYLRVADRNLRIGLRLSAIGLAGAAVGSICRALYIVVAWVFGPVVKILLLLGVPFVIAGGMLFLAGVTYPGVRARVSALRRRRQHRREHAALAPLWTVLVEAFPSIVLRTPPRGRGGVNRLHYRRVIEIRDGLVQLSPYLDADFGAVVAEDPAAAAAALRAALRRHAAGEASDGRAKQVLPAGADDIESDVRPLLALSAAMANGK
ncbi:MAB_1171c family putative transporter [Amycolatopsis sp.]|uniref:MAB_1171c family putative transporter n=1 Tax=Amycolatopsis sp. TaxID=37632 RepID=UPI002D7F4EC8|nr:MAB_1171c family putative transporter [Amycolatopsis sp.]HET6703666.1 MAB_1171c family putative transporter [Amycolatopsis sp.]